MTEISRRVFMAAATTAPLLTALRLNAAPLQRIALYDPTIDAGSEFARRAAELGLTVAEISEDRIRLLTTILAGSPQSVWGVSRHADRLLASGIMREHGYRARVMLRCLNGEADLDKGRTGTVPDRISAGRRGVAFAEIAAGRSLSCETIQAGRGDRSAIFWSFQRVR